jgi:hypothetical protein
MPMILPIMKKPPLLTLENGWLAAVRAALLAQLHYQILV